MERRNAGLCFFFPEWSFAGTGMYNTGQWRCKCGRKGSGYVDPYWTYPELYSSSPWFFPQFGLKRKGCLVRQSHVAKQKGIRPVIIFLYWIIPRSSPGFPPRWGTNHVSPPTLSPFHLHIYCGCQSPSRGYERQCQHGSNAVALAVTHTPRLTPYIFPLSIHPGSPPC